MYRIYEPLKLNLGCGATLFPDWINVDISPTADIVADVTKNLPFKDSSVAFIYSEHLVEHLYVSWDRWLEVPVLEGAISMLKECFRVLRPDGVMRIATPDLDELINSYSGDWKDQSWLWRPEYSYIRTRGLMLNVSMRGGGHEYLFNGEDLSGLLWEHGFVDVRRFPRNESRHETLKGLETREDSKLIVECRRFPFDKVNLIGDSHIAIASGRFPFELHSMNEILDDAPPANNLMKTNGGHDWLGAITNTIDDICGQDDLVLFSAGEIDCRIHIYYQHMKSGRSIDELIEGTIDNYVVFLRLMYERRVNFCVLGIPPAGRQEENRFGYPYYASREQRIPIFEQFNRKLRERCGKEGFRYIDLYSSTVDDDGLINLEFAEDDEFVEVFGDYHGTHLNRKAFRFVLEYMEQEFCTADD